MLWFSISDKRYAEGCRCPKSLWLDEHSCEGIQLDPFNRYESGDNDAESAQREREVLNLAMGYYGEYSNVPLRMGGGLSHMAYMTQRFLDEGKQLICRATFRDIEGSVEKLCQVDILRVGQEGVHIVKVTASRDAQLSDLRQLAYQLWFLEEHGFNVKSASIMHLNGDYVRRGELDLRELFAVKDVTTAARAQAADVANNLRLFKWFAWQLDEEPEIPLGPQCDSAPLCRYREWCRRDLPTPNVLDIVGIGDEGWRAYEKGIVDYEDVAKAYDEGLIQLSQRQHNEVFSYLNGLDEVIDADGLAECLKPIKYPLYFLDFGISEPSGIPLYDGMRPYRLLPVQYTVGVQREREGEFEGRDLLCYGDDPRRFIAESLCADIPRDACVPVYGIWIPRAVLADLAKQFPDLHDHLMSIRENLVDVMGPFLEGLYYKRNVEGWPALQDVAKAMLPDDPEIDFSTLATVKNEEDARKAYEQIPSASPEHDAKIVQALIAYRRMRVFAIERLLDKLYEIAEENMA